MLMKADWKWDAIQVAVVDVGHYAKKGVRIVVMEAVKIHAISVAITLVVEQLQIIGNRLIYKINNIDMKKEVIFSRRSFFKKAIKNVLPIVGGIIMLGAPSIIKAAGPNLGCDGGCDNRCYNTCYGSCKGSCTSCKGNCSQSCTGCSGSCYLSCSSCRGNCTSSSTY